MGFVSQYFFSPFDFIKIDLIIKFMNITRYLRNMLFESFPFSLKTTSWSTYSSKSYEVVFKYLKKSFKNQNFLLSG